MDFISFEQGSFDRFQFELILDEAEEEKEVEEEGALDGEVLELFDIEFLFFEVSLDFGGFFLDNQRIAGKFCKNYEGGVMVEFFGN